MMKLHDITVRLLSTVATATCTCGWTRAITRRQNAWVVMNGHWRDVMEVYICPHCGAVSHSPNDAKHGYCGSCHRWGTPDDTPVVTEARLRFTLEQLREWGGLSEEEIQRIYNAERKLTS